MDKVVHFEIPADDVARAKKFYNEVFGWYTEDYQQMDYVIVRTGPVDKDRMPSDLGFINGGMMKRNENVKNPVITIDVKDIDKTLKEIKSKGGKIVTEKMPVGEMGFVAYFKDSEENLLGLWQSK